MEIWVEDKIPQKGNGADTCRVLIVYEKPPVDQKEGMGLSFHDLSRDGHTTGHHEP